jgi:hypothetical protein
MLEVRRTFPLTLAYLASVRLAGYRAVSLYLSMGIGSFVLFGGQGLSAATVTHWAIRSPGARFALLVGWLVATGPVVRPLVNSPELSFLRPLPVPLPRILGLVALAMVFAELPWAILWTRGAGVMLGAGALAIALGLHAFQVARLRNAGDVALVFVLFLGWLTPWPAMWPVLGMVGLLVGLRAAWRRVLEPPSRSSFRTMHRGRTLALAAAYWRTLFRAHGTLLFRVGALVATAAGFACLVIVNNRISDLALRRAIALGLFAPVSAVAAGSLAAPVLRIERESAWFLDVCAVPSFGRRAAAVLPIASIGAVLGFVYGSIVATFVGSEIAARARLGCDAAALAIGIALACDSIARWALRERGRDAGRLMSALAIVIVVAELVVAAGEMSVVAGLIVVTISRLVPVRRMFAAANASC